MPKGPAPKGAYSGKSSVFSTRIRPDLRKSLEKAARQSGRSLSQEVEHRLRHSILEDEKIEDTFGDRQTYRLMRMMADGIHLASGWTEAHWLKNPVSFGFAKAAIASILDRVAPGEPESLRHPLHDQAAAACGDIIAAVFWAKTRAAADALPLNKGSDQDWKYAVAKADLAHLLDRTFRNSDETFVERVVERLRAISSKLEIK
jgi:TraY domain